MVLFTIYDNESISKDYNTTALSAFCFI